MTGADVEDGERLQGWRRHVVVGAGVAGAAVLAGAVLGLLLAGGSSAPSRSAAVAALPALASGALVVAPSAEPEELDEPSGMGSQHAGVALLATGVVDEVRTTDGRRRAPEGSRLVAFRLGDWTCEVHPCGHWRSLQPQVEVDGHAQPLPDPGDTFVVVVPPGSSTVELTIDADGQAQMLSLLDGEPGPENIALLSERGQEKRVHLGRTLDLAEHTSIPLDDGTGVSTDVFQRTVTVDFAQEHFFLGGAVPSSPRRAFLVVNAFYSYAGRPGQFILGPGEVVFVDAHGTRYEPRDLDPAPDKGLLGFEVPASVRSGTLVIGGSRDEVSTTGVPYVSTLDEQRVPVALG